MVVKGPTTGVEIGRAYPKMGGGGVEGTVDSRSHAILGNIAFLLFRGCLPVLCCFDFFFPFFFKENIIKIGCSKQIITNFGHQAQKEVEQNSASSTFLSKGIDSGNKILKK